MKDKKRPILIDISQACAQLGINTRTMYVWINQRKLPFYKIGKFIRFDQDELDDWVREQRVEVFNS